MGDPFIRKFIGAFDKEGHPLGANGKPLATNATTTLNPYVRRVRPCNTSRDNSRYLQLGQYALILEEFKGAGTFGKVYKAHEIRYDKRQDDYVMVKGAHFIVKVVAIESYDESEIKVLKNIKKFCRPDLLCLSKVFYSDLGLHREVFILFDYLGDHMHDFDMFIKAQLASDETLLTDTHMFVLMYQIISIMAKLHDQNVFHRDFKPANMMVSCETGKCQFIDFGTTCVLMDERSTANCWSPLGSQAYMSPDLYKMLHDRKTAGKESVEMLNRSADIWALGITLLELASCRNRYFNLDSYLYGEVDEQINALVLGNKQALQTHIYAKIDGLTLSPDEHNDKVFKQLCKVCLQVNARNLASTDLHRVAEFVAKNAGGIDLTQKIHLHCPGFKNVNPCPVKK